MTVIAHQFPVQKGKKIPSVWKVCFIYKESEENKYDKENKFS